MTKKHYSTRLGAIKSSEQLCEIAAPLIRKKTRRLARRPEFEEKDVAQEAYLRLLNRYASGAAADLPVLVFVNRVVNQAIANYKRRVLAQKRNPHSVRSLNAPRGDAELSDTLSQSQLEARYGRRSREVLELVAMGIDVGETIAKLSQEQRELCEGFLGVDSVAELVRSIQQPRATVVDKMRKLKRKLSNSGLHAYRE